ncbi:MAG: putative histidine kinase [Rhodospirillales bacterium]|nr:putative histidine kinase [Rhodospirillales bacterium]
MILDIIENALEDLSPTVTTATNADDAMAMLDGGLRPRVLITNVRLPGEVDGLGLAREARRRVPGLAVIVISGDKAFLDESDGLPDAHLLRKPFRVQDLLDVVGQRLR